MEAILLIGIQGAGKSTFYRDRFVDTHVLDNTHPTAAERLYS